MSEEMKKEIGTQEMNEAAGGVARGYIVYTVVKGNTLSKLANRFGVTVNELASWNKIPNPNLIVIGQKLKIYV